MSSEKQYTKGPPAPVFISLPADEGVHTAPTVDIWYVSCTLATGERRFDTQVVAVTNIAEPVTTHAYLVESGTGEQRHEIRSHSDIASGIKAGCLDIRLPNLSLSGSHEGFTLWSAVGRDSIELVLSPRSPVLYANGTGLFPCHGGGTHQYSLPDLGVSGALTIDGETVDVEGQGWFDRQWAPSAAAFGSGDGFIWMGLCLSNGDNLSLWDSVAPDGNPYCWATVVRPDSTHIIAPVVLNTGPGGSAARGPWVVGIPSLDVELTVSQKAIHDEGNFYSGACTVSGTRGSAPVTGYGYVDVLQR
ncbi:MAG: lipocalin-like domain-containing protein [Porticoccaceae bacterium]|jgi:predicted secreted hydrolase